MLEKATCHEKVLWKDVAVNPADICSSTHTANTRMIGSRSAAPRDGGSRLACWSLWSVLPVPCGWLCDSPSGQSRAHQ